MFCPVIWNHPIKKSAAKQGPSSPAFFQFSEWISLFFLLLGLLAAFIAVTKKSKKILNIAKGTAIAGCAWSFWQLADEMINGQE